MAEEVKKPECFRKYEATFPKQGKVCRACNFAQKCKPKKVDKQKDLIK